MDANQVKEIISSGENQEVELKESFHSNQDISKIICSMANTLGGILVLGVNDKGEIKGMEKSLDRLQQEVANSSQAVSPAPIISVETHKIKGKNVLVVIVQRASDGTYHTFHGAIYVRIGSTTKRLEGQTHLEFLRNRQILSFDESYDSLVRIEDLDEIKIRAYLKLRNQESYLESHSIKDFLVSNRLASNNGGLKIKSPAVLFFGKNSVQFYPQIEMKLVQFSGKEPVKIIAHKLVQDNIMNSIEQSIDFVKNHINKSIKIMASKREELYEYPESVIREAIVNAVAHRDYFSKDSIQIYVFDDRMEITNPGSLPHGLPKELFGTISVQRNPITYRFLRDMGYVEGLGTGIPRMKNEMRSFGLEDPKFMFTETFFRITLYNKKGKRSPIESIADLNERQKKALVYLKKHKSIKAKTYADINKISNTTAVNEINELIQYNYLKKIGAYRNAYYIIEK